MKRRTLLAAAGTATLSAIAGCAGEDEPDGEPSNNGTEPSGNETDGPGGDTDRSGDGPERELVFEDSFSAASQGGFLAIDQDVETRSEAREEGYVLPEGEEVLTLEAEVAEDGSWEANDVEFPSIETDIGIEATIELPDGLSGVLNQDRMTATGTLQVVIQPPLEDEFSFEIEATTEQSGSLEGETNFEEAPPTAVLVDNEFVIDDEADNSLINSQLGLPADEPGTNWFEIEVELTGE